MTQTEFWKIIGLLDWTIDDDDAMLQPAVDALAELSTNEIYQFEEILAEKLYKLDGEAYARNIGEDSYTVESEDEESDGYFSADLFLYTRCYVVAKGKQYYNKVLSDPKKMPKDSEFEAILELARTAYEKKTGKEFKYVTKTNYETFSNKKRWN